MAHDNYMMLISLDLDGMLSERERNDLRQHTQTCIACAHAWERMRLTDSMLKVPPEIAPARDFRARVMGQVKHYETQRRLRPWLLVILTAMTVGVLVSTALPFVILVFQLYQPLLSWPVVGTALAWLAQGFSAVVGLLGQLIVDLQHWLVYLTNDPVALAFVIGGLVVACTWIGLLEVTKGGRPLAEPLAEMSQQQA